jgi:hypothetical protein
VVARNKEDGSSRRGLKVGGIDPFFVEVEDCKAVDIPRMSFNRSELEQAHANQQWLILLERDGKLKWEFGTPEWARKMAQR